MSKVEKRESIAWTLGVVASVIAIFVFWSGLHEKYELGKSSYLRDIAIVKVIKNQLASRKSIYTKQEREGVELTDKDEHRVLVIEYDQRDVEQLEEAFGLETHDE